MDKGSDKVVFNELNWTPETLKDIRKIFIVACGTAYHAGIVGKYYIEKWPGSRWKWTSLPNSGTGTPIIDESCLCIVISQSGETSDTLEA